MGWDSLGSWGSLLSGAADLAGTAYAMYQGSQTNDTAAQYYNAAGDAAKDQVAFSREQWARYKSVYGPLEEAQVKEALLDMEANRPLKAAILDETQRNIENYRPIEDQMIAEAGKSGSALGQEYAARSSADINQAFGQQKAINSRNLGRMGVNPNSGRFANTNKSTNTAQALALAGGKTSAFQRGQTEALNRKANALNYRRGLPMVQKENPNGSATLSSALNAMSSGVANTASLAGIASNAASSSNQTAGYLLGQGAQALGNVNWGNIGNQISGMFSSGNSGATGTTALAGLNGTYSAR
ncbi:hypothetical protein [Maridesulfovibrio sp.]|uniref:hypothetical protein n=1 Tax=Maridesulfovibrio sp. TaxID=2795000 RepID=UPI0029CA707F|nr:hypothetical protein [Maridesulfovibrio sp.]